jgi:hypothetical protein
MEVHVINLNTNRTIFLNDFFPQILPELKFESVHVFTHPLITKHEKRITGLKYWNEKQ